MRTRAYAAAFLDEERVLFQQEVDTSVDDIGIVRYSLHVADGASITEVDVGPDDPEQTNFTCQVELLDHEAVACEGGYLMTLDGETLATEMNLASVLGVHAGRGIVGYAYDGSLMIIDRDGSKTELPRAATPFAGFPDQATGIGPFADFVPPI